MPALLSAGGECEGPTVARGRPSTARAATTPTSGQAGRCNDKAARRRAIPSPAQIIVSLPASRFASTLMPVAGTLGRTGFCLDGIDKGLEATSSASDTNELGHRGLLGRDGGERSQPSQ